VRSPSSPRALALLVLVVVLGSAAATVWVLRGQRPASSFPERPDVLLVVLDTVRADRLSAYGYSRPTSPMLEDLATVGVRFDDVTAPGSWTWPSHASLFTGLAPWVHGAHTVRGEGTRSGRRPNVASMREDVPTLAERFTAAGYRTVALSSNSWLSRELGLTRGFERVVCDRDTGVIIELALQEMERDDDRPLLLFLNYMFAHAPWRVTPSEWTQAHAPALTSPADDVWLGPYVMADDGPGLDLNKVAPGGDTNGFLRYHTGQLDIPAEGLAMISDLYDGELRVDDEMLRRTLDRWSLTRPVSVVAVTSDHGEYLGERDLLEHGRTVYPEVVRIPMVVAAPGVLPAGAVVETPVQLQDLHPTLLELAGIEEEPGGSLLPVVAGDTRPGPIQAAAWSHPGWAGTAGGRFAEDWKLYREGPDALILGSGGTVELYDLGADPQMSTDLAPGRAERVRELTERASAAFPESDREATQLDLSPEMIERLEALGYVVDSELGAAHGTPVQR
jgi:arylsulfatase A-like enzyme